MNVKIAMELNQKKSKQMKTTFCNLDRLDFFTIRDEFGHAVFMKRDQHKAVCIESFDGTYEKAREYFFQDETIVNYDK